MVLEMDGQRYRLIEDSGPSAVDVVRAKTLGALTVSGVLSLSAFGLTALDDSLSAAADIGVRVLCITSPIMMFGALVVSPLVDRLGHNGQEPAGSEPPVGKLPTPRRQREPLPDGMAAKIGRALARGPRKRGRYQDDIQPVRAIMRKDWVPEFYEVTARMYHEPLTRVRFDELWTGGQNLYYRYVRPRYGVPDWDNGRWDYLRMIRPVDGRGAMEFCVSLDEILQHTPRLWSYALAHGHSPTGEG